MLSNNAGAEQTKQKQAKEDIEMGHQSLLFAGSVLVPGGVSGGYPDHAHQPPRIRCILMTGAAVTEETIIGIGILSHGSRRDSRLLQLAQRIARQVKTKMVRGVIIDEIRLCPRGGGDDLIPQVWPDLI
jgi:hypothetical protein